MLRILGEGPDGLRLSALDRLSDAQLMAVQARVLQGWNSRRIAERLEVGPETVERWFREPGVIAAALELQRGFLAAEILPLGLQRLRRELALPGTKAGDVVRIVRLAADLIGLGSPEGGNASAPPGKAAGSPGAHGRPLEECTADELRAIAAQGREALANLARRARPAGEPGEPAEGGFDSYSDILDG